MKPHEPFNDTDRELEPQPRQVCEIRKCSRESCGLRFPVLVDAAENRRCPRCRAETQVLIERTLEREAAQPGARSAPGAS